MTGAGWDAAVLAAAFGADLALGEPPPAVHPVVWMGKAIRACERLAPARGRAAPFVAGAVLALAVPSAFATGAALLVRAAGSVPVLAVLLSAALLKSSFAIRALGRAALRVGESLGRGDLGEARERLRWLCSRDPSQLGPEALAAGAIESLAENLSDSLVAPLLYFALLGVPGAVFYRAVNTLDAMIGYHGKYEWIGKAAARLDDVLNLVPARLTAGLLLLAGALAGQDPARGWRVLRRDAALTESPNAGRPMAAMAGLLAVELTKAGQYRLGDPAEALTAVKIAEAWGVVRIAAGLTFVAALLVTWGIHGIR